MVDSGGTLYYIVHSFNNGFAWYRFVVGKITSDGTQSRYEFALDVSCMGAYALWKNNIGSETSQYGNIAWVTMMPCIAQEVNGTSEYIHVVTYVPPSRWWNTSSGGDTEGLMFLKIKKSDLSINTTKFIAAYKGEGNYTGRGLRADGFGDFTTLIHNRNVFTAINNVNEKKTVVFWPHKNSHSIDTYDANSNLSHRQLLQINNDTLGQTFYGTTELGPTNTTCWEPRVIILDNHYRLLVSSGYTPIVVGMNFGYSGGPHPISTDQVGYFDTSNNTVAGCNYHSDLGVAGGRFLVLCMTKTSRIWSASYVSWNTSYVALALFNFDLSYNTCNCPTENCIAVFPVTTGTHEEATSTTTLYKNTFQCVAYNNHIIYAYCYPGRKTHLVLGVARYRLDANNNVHLLTKREFVDKDGNSFSPLTDCSRLLFMDVKNGYLWIVFFNTGRSAYRTICISAQDVINQTI
ncbi:MAG: hypothetical protein LBH52_04355 [Puniceicoccales bacterium]|jgi:hypothetical protein|nr:hypothetical protein [Puniceicoccales bacterium]